MARKTWEIELDGANHKVEFNLNYLSSERNVYIDEKRLTLDNQQNRPPVYYGEDIPFKINEHPCVIIIRVSRLIYNYDLVVDGVSFKTGSPYIGEKVIEPNDANSKFIFSLFKHNNYKIVLTGLVGATLCIIVFFIALDMRDIFSEYLVLILPGSLLLGMLFIGYGFTGKLVGAIKGALIIIVIAAVYAIFSRGIDQLLNGIFK